MNARVAQMFGGRGGSPTNVSFSGTVAALALPDNASYVYLTGTSTPIVSALSINPSQYGRIIVLENEGATSITLTSTTSAWTEGQMDLGSADITLATGDIVGLYVRKDGVVRRLFSTDN